MSTVITDTDAKANISANVRRLLDAKGMNQAKLATLTEESNARISLLINGKHLPSSAFLARLAEALGVSTDTLLARPKYFSGKPRKTA